MNTIIIKADGLENKTFLVDFNNMDRTELIIELKELDIKSVEILLPTATPVKVEKVFKASLAMLIILGITATFGVSQVNTYVKGGFTKGADKDTKEYWLLRGYLTDVQSDESMAELKEIGKVIDQLEESVKIVNNTLAKLSSRGVLASTTLSQVGIYHKSVRSAKDIGGVIDYEKSEQYVKQIEKFDS